MTYGLLRITYEPIAILNKREYATPVLGLIFLKFADNNYRRYEQSIQKESQKLQGSRREKPISAS